MENYINFCRVVINFIKEKIDVKDNNFDKFIDYMKNKAVNNNLILKEILKEYNLTEFVKTAGIGVDKRKRLQFRRCLQVISLALIKCPEYDSLKEKLKKLTKLSDKQTRNLIKQYIPLLKKFNPNLNLRKWLPKSYYYTYIKVKKLVEDVGLKRIGKNGILLKPNHEKEFEELAKNQKPNRVPLLVKCGACGYKWFTNAFNLQQKNWCKYCVFNIYTYDKVKILVESKGFEKSGIRGILLKPESKMEFKELARKEKPNRVPILVKCGTCGYKWSTNADRLQQGKWCERCGKGMYTYNKVKYLMENVGLEKAGEKGVLITPKNEKEFDELTHKFPPSRVPLLIECRLCEYKWSSNADRLQRKHWCPICSEGEFEQICRWYLEKILSFMYQSKIIFVKTQLSKVINFYNISNYSEAERELIHDLIKHGHLDGYSIFKNEKKTIEIAFEYNGEQHYKFLKYFHKVKADFTHQILRDKVKKKLCEENDIILLEFPYYIDKKMKNSKKIQNYIVKELMMKTSIEIPYNLPKYDHISPDFGQYRLDQYLKDNN